MIQKYNRVDLGWNWGGNSKFFNMAERHVDRSGGKGFVIVASNKTPCTADTAPFPAIATL